MFEGLIGLFSKFGPELMKMLGDGAGGSGGTQLPSQNSAKAAQSMPMAPTGNQNGPAMVPQGQSMGQNASTRQLSPEDQKFMQQQQIGQNGMQNMQQNMAQGMAGVNNPGYKDMSQQGDLGSLMKMLMSMGGR